LEKGVRFNSPTDHVCPKKDDYRDFPLVTHLIGTQNFISVIPMIFSDRHIITLLSVLGHECVINSISSASYIDLKECIFEVLAMNHLLSSVEGRDRW
jgi:hypothetical protein